MPLYKSLLKTAYKSSSNEFIDEIETLDRLDVWLKTNGFENIISTDELIFNLQNIRHMVKKIMNQLERDNVPDVAPLNKFSEKFKTNHLLQIGRSSTDFFKDTVLFEEPYHSILMSFKEDYKNKLLNNIS